MKGNSVAVEEKADEKAEALAPVEVKTEPKAAPKKFSLMQYVQQLGKAIMLPVAVLPICGLLMGIGYLLCPATMQGGDINNCCII